MGIGAKWLWGAAAAVVLVAGAGVVRADEWRLATIAPPGSTWMKIMDRGAAAVAEATEKRITIRYYSGGLQGDERDVVRKMRQGGLDGGALSALGLGMIDESIRVLELPRMYRDLAEMDYVRSRMWPYFQRKFAKRGFMLGEPGDVGWIYLMSTHRIETLEQLQNARAWMPGDKLSNTMIRRVGMRGVPLGISSVLPSLISGRIDTTFGSPLAAIALQWAGKIRFMSAMPASYAMGATVIRKEVWDRRSPEDQRKMQIINRNLGRTLRKMVRRDNDEALALMKRKGVKVVPVRPAAVALFEMVAKDVWQELAGDIYSQAELDMVLALRDEYRAAQAKAEHARAEQAQAE